MQAIFRLRLGEPLVSLRNSFTRNAALFSRGSLRTQTTDADNALKHYGQYRWWSQDDVDTMLRLHQEGADTRQIATHLNRSRRATDARLKNALNNGKLVVSRSRHVRLWTDQEYEQLIRLREQGFSMSKIAAALGRSRRSVEGRLRMEKERALGIRGESGLHLGQPFGSGDFERINDMRAQGHTWGKIASLMSRTIDSVRTFHSRKNENINSKSHKRWSSEEDDTLMDLKRQGRSFDEIATQFPGRTAIAVSNRYHRHLVRSGVQKVMHGRKWTEEEVQKLRLLRETGASYAEIAAQLGRSAEAAAVKHQELFQPSRSPSRE